MSDATLTQNKLTFRHVARSPVFVGISATILVGSLLYFGLTYWAGENDESTNKDPGPLAVPVVTVKQNENAWLSRQFSGLIRAQRSSELAFERAAKLETVFVDEGDCVSKGDTLAKLDSRDLQFSLDRVTAELASAQATYKELKAGPRQEVIASARADVAARLAELDFARKQRDRRSDLSQTNSISAEELDNAQSAFDIAEANHKSAEKKLDELEAGTRVEKIEAQKAIVDQLEARLKQVKLDIEKSVLLAPFDGKISARFKDEGTIVASGMPILAISESSKLEAVVGLPPKTLKYISEKQSFKCMVDGDPCQATVTRILPETDETTRTIPVIFDLSDSGFKPGQIIRVPIREPRKHAGFWLPTEALLPATKGLWSVFVVVDKDGKQIAQRRYVTVHLNDGGRSLIGEKQDLPTKMSLITGTIKPGDKVISSGVHKITIGQQVKVVKP